MPPSTGTQQSSLNTLKTVLTPNPTKGKSLVTKAIPSLSNQEGSQEEVTLQTRTTPGPSEATGSSVWVACPTCGIEVIVEKIRLDIHKLSGPNSARKYLNFRINGSRKTLEKLLQAQTD
jgi:hypothetical protein